MLRVSEIGFYTSDFRILHVEKPCHLLIGWSDKNQTNLHFIVPLETHELTTSAAEQSFMYCDLLKCMLLSF